MKTSFKKRSLALVLAGLMVFSSGFTGYSVKADASETTYVTVEQLENNNTDAPAADSVVPDANQYEYQKQELAAFCHFGMNTYSPTNAEWGTGDEELSQFALTQKIDADSYVEALKNAGFKKIIVTAKHHDGFCIWDSEYTEHDIASTDYPGDVLEDLSAACTEHEMDMGLYLSPWDMHEPSFGYVDANGNATTAEGDTNGDYNEFYNNQLKEILSSDKYGNAGHFKEVWMDGANNSAYPQDYTFTTWFETIQTYEGTAAAKYDADCLLFGAEAYTTVRWIGNESGLANEQTWAQVIANNDSNTRDWNDIGDYNAGYANGNEWTVPEADARINTGWFWHPGQSPKSLEDLANMYFNSVGHNAVLLLNVPLNREGTLGTDYFTRVEEFGTAIRESFDENLATNSTVAATAVRGNDTAYSPANVIDGKDDTYWTVDDGATSGTLHVDLGSSKTFDVVSIEEAIQFGQRITSFRVEYSTDNTEWKVFDEGTTVGSKRLSRKAPVSAQYLKITVATNNTEGIYTSTHEKALSITPGVPMISEIGVYKASEAFQLADAVPDGMTIIDDRQFTYTGTWTEVSGSQFSIDQTGQWCNSGASFTVTFTGSKIYLIGTVDPGHGTANVSIDGEDSVEINTQADTRVLGQVIFESNDLGAGEHTLTLNATGTIGIDGAYVIDNGGVGMVGIEQSSYTMNEASEMEVKLVRVGGTADQDVTVTLAPNPGSAYQKHFNTELVETVTFENGAAEAYATVQTYRDEDQTGDLYFTIELSSDTENVILGYNTSAKVTIVDAEAGQYTEGNPFVFPNALNETKRLEGESAYELVNDDDSEEWPLKISEGEWASEGKFLNCLDDSGDIAYYTFEAPYAGVYTVTLKYNSGADAASKNSVSWSTLNENQDGYEGGVITAGNSGDVEPGMGTKDFTMTVEKAGAGVLVLTPGTNKAPQIDYFDITLQSFATHTVTATTAGNGTITVDNEAVPAEGVDVAVNESKTFVFTANEGYEIEDVTVDGESVGKVDSYTVTNPTADVAIEVTFTVKPFEFPTVVGESATLQGESAYDLVNDDEEEAWPLQIADKGDAEGGKALSCLDDAGDIAYYKFDAPCVGVYSVQLKYFSGDTANGFKWSTTSDSEGFIKAGEVESVAHADNNGSTLFDDVTFTMVVTKAGTGVLALEPDADKAPTIDCFVITLSVSKAELQNAITEAEAVTEGSYTADSYAKLEEALKAAREVLENTDATQDEVDTATTALNTAIDGLVPNIIEIYVGQTYTFQNTDGNCEESWTEEDGVVIDDIVRVDSVTDNARMTKIDNVSKIDETEQYLLENYRIKNMLSSEVPTSQITSNNGNRYGLEMSSSSDAVLKLENLDIYLWQFDLDEGTIVDEGTSVSAKIYQGNNYLYFYNGSRSGSDSTDVGLRPSDTTTEAQETMVLTHHAYNDGVWLIKNHEDARNKDYYLNDYGSVNGNKGAAGYAFPISNLSEDGGDGNKWYIYEYDSYTDITVTGLSVGETTVTVGDATYTIKVTEPEYIVDFGLPVELDFADVDGYALTAGNYESTYADVVVADNAVIYTPNTTLKGADTVTIPTENGVDATIKVYPATSVYYEENFISFTNKNGEWTLPTVVRPQQQAAQPGDTQAYNYGYDAAYEVKSDTYALTNTVRANGTFRFTGTGVDIYANCDAGTGIVMALIKAVNADDTTTLKQVVSIDTALKPGEHDSGMGLGNTYSQTYNVPIISVDGLDYGNYEVMVVHVAKKDVETTLLLDGFRVYGTMEEQDVYDADNEANPGYYELRDSVLAGIGVAEDSSGEYAEQIAGSTMSQVYDSVGAKNVGAVVVSGSENTKVYTGDNLPKFLDQSSKNELYLYPGQSLVFKLTAGTVNPQIALKALTGADAGVAYTMIASVGEETIASVEKTMKNNTEMYYPLTMDANADTTFTITNNSTAEVLSVTNLKITNVTEEETAVLTFGRVTPDDLIPAMLSLGYEEEPDSETDTFKEVARISGNNRNETSYKVADKLKAVLGIEKFDTVIVATGKKFADALAGSYLASVKNAPILLTNGKDDNVEALCAYINGNLAENGTIYILGGEDAVPANVQTALVADYGDNVVRLAGGDRYETNLLILDVAGVKEGTDLIVATGKDFADSLSASALKKPILLVRPQEGALLTNSQKAVAEKAGKIYIVGGTDAVSAATEEELKEYAEVERIAGAGRQETSKLVADKFFGDVEGVVLAKAMDFPDGLSGGPLAAALDIPLLLTRDEKSDIAESYVQGLGIESGYVLGGTDALADQTVTDVFALENSDGIVLR